MKAIKFIVALFIVLTAVQSVQAEDNTVENNQSTSIFTKKQIVDNEGVEIYDSNLQMKQNKIIGAGLAVGGVTGLLGLNAEINIQPENAIYLGMGAGKSYNTFNFGYKKNFEGYYLSPYTKVGFSKWFSDKSKNDDAKNSSVLNQILSQNEISENRFNENFITGSAGIEYNQLEGELSGVNFFGELVLMGSISTSKIVPTGSIGMTYFY